MSYILDALVRAEQERQAAAVPGLRTVQVLPFPISRQPPRRLAAAAAAGLLAAGLAWAWSRGQPPALPAATALAGAVAAGPAISVPPTPVRPEGRDITGPAQAPPAVGPEKPRAAPMERHEPPPRLTDVRPNPRLYGIAELPAALQKTAQDIRIAGFAHAKDAKERMAIINDRAWREGDEVTEGLRVESISGDGVVFNLKGYRFRKGAA